MEIDRRRLLLYMGRGVNPATFRGAVPTVQALQSDIIMVPRCVRRLLRNLEVSNDENLTYTELFLTVCIFTSLDILSWY